ncbi:MAG: carbamoyltransferase C-terminal domain-containing protein [Bryobacteraceae bacterium]|jgi:carbamoyltransferase
MIILGLGGILKDGAAALLRDGELVAAIEEKKIARHWASGALPLASMAECMRLASAGASDVNTVAIAQPVATGALMHAQLRSLFPNAKLALVEHQTAHAASAYYASGFDQATVLTLDRAGDFRCGARYRGHGNRLELETEMYYPDSIGDLYSRVTELLGFKPDADEHKIQWLSTAGDGRFTTLFSEMLGHGARLNAAFFDANRVGNGGFGARFYEGLGLEEGDAVPEGLKAAVARGLQGAVERAVLELAGDGENLCVAGGLFFNALLIAALERKKNVFVQPAAGNSGTAIGAVLYAWHHLLGRKERVSLADLCLGPGYAAEEIKQVLENCKLRFHYLQTTEELVDSAVRALDDQKIIAWMQGRMEFGPRALGNRSILASPLNPYSTENLNIFIKHREPFRKFAASVPAELAATYFEAGPNARYLATVSRVRPAYRERFQSAILGDDLVRVHTVSAADNPLYHRLLLAAGKATGLPVLYNTSFNLFGDPLVCAPRDAVRSFYSSGIDALFAGNFFIEK